MAGARDLEGTAVLRSAELRCGGGAAGKLSFYRPGATQSAHAHALPSLSLVVSGRIRESVGRSDACVPHGAICIKPEGVRHSDAYGPEGAMILSVSVEDPELWDRSFGSERWHWSSPEPRRLAELLALFRRWSGGEDKGGALVELIALAQPQRPRTGLAPKWLREVRERLDEGSDATLGKLAVEAGVHPVYLSRAFAAWYRTSPSSYRLRRKASAAVALALGGGMKAADVALESGFADQSHMCRSVRKSTEHSLSELLALLPPPPSVRETIVAPGPRC
jgi:AraC family transcriptional regulator